MSLSIREILPDDGEELLRTVMDIVSTNIRVAIPGIIQSFNPVEQTVTVQPAIRERLVNPDLSVSTVEIPLLLDVPIVIPRAGKFALTVPVQPGDECIVLFTDMCYNAWWSNGGVQNQEEKRRHDLSDGIAILGCYSQPNVISNYSTDSVQLRNESGTQYIEISDTGVNIVGTVMVNGNPIG